MNLVPIFDWQEKYPVLIAGPCSAESEEQIMTTARELSKQNIDLFRAGIWKPRTRPGSFEGVGKVGLPWLNRVQEELGMKVTTEVAKAEHVDEALKHGIDVLWIGARTTVNPFSVQEIALAIEGTDIPVLIKNPINADLGLWIGAIERIHNAGINRIGVIHRGFADFGNKKFRNKPMWQIPIKLMKEYPNLTFICDNSHICGRRDLLQSVAQTAMDLKFHGLMTETHPDPDNAWSDAKQQITPSVFQSLIASLVLRSFDVEEIKMHEIIDLLRDDINKIDEELIQLLGKRMNISEEIGKYKMHNRVSILQPSRWQEILNKSVDFGATYGLSQQFVENFFSAIHQESINHQSEVMNRSTKEVK